MQQKMDDEGETSDQMAANNPQMVTHELIDGECNFFACNLHKFRAVNKLSFDVCAVLLNVGGETGSYAVPGSLQILMFVCSEMSQTML